MILITGVTGFIGKHLLKSLINLHGKENILALTSKPTSMCNYLLHDGYSFSKSFFVEKGYDNIDTIIHVGAFIPKSGADINNVENCTSNITSTFKLLAAELPKLKKFIFISTVDVYGFSNPVTEETVVSPASLYGHSKLYCEEMISAWASQKGVCHQILRVGHVYGPGEEDYKKIIPVTIKNLLLKTSPKLYGEGKDIRSFIYISDVIDAIINSLKLEKYQGVINIVSEEQITIKELVYKIISISGLPIEPEKVDYKGKSRDLVFDNTKLKNLLYEPKVSLNEGLKNEIIYFKSP